MLSSGDAHSPFSQSQQRCLPPPRPAETSISNVNGVQVGADGKSSISAACSIDDNGRVKIGDDSAARASETS